MRRVVSAAVARDRTFVRAMHAPRHPRWERRRLGRRGLAALQLMKGAPLQIGVNFFPARRGRKRLRTGMRAKHPGARYAKVRSPVVLPLGVTDPERRR